MSLINEALKKAQRQRANDDARAASAEPVAQTTETGQPVASSPAVDSARPPLRRKPAPAQTVVLLTVGAMLLLLGGGVSAYLILGTSDTSPAPQPVVVQPQQAAPVAIAQSPKPEPAPVVTIELPPDINTPIAVATTPATAAATIPAPSQAPAAAPVPPSPAVVQASPEASASTPVSATPATPQPVTPSPKPATPVPAPVAAAPTTPAQTTHEINLFLEKIRVAGIKASPTDPRVLMNDRMFRLNDMVDARLQLRLTGITNLALTFTDAYGVQYTHNF